MRSLLFLLSIYKMYMLLWRMMLLLIYIYIISPFSAHENRSRQPIACPARRPSLLITNPAPSEEWCAWWYVHIDTQPCFVRVKYWMPAVCTACSGIVCHFLGHFIRCSFWLLGFLFPVLHYWFSFCYLVYDCRCCRGGFVRSKVRPANRLRYLLKC